MAAIRLIVDKKFLARHLEAYDREAAELLATGINIQEQAVIGELEATNKQVETLSRLLLDEGLRLMLADDGDLSLAID